ncbi:MAG: hypothetical protein WCP45_14325, partial [Verrucomicrobiota bacterium]
MRTRRRPCSPSRGFALVVVLLLMVLLTVLGVGLLSVSSIALRGTEKSTFEGRAKANAQLALILALGKLQREVGPDTRATAPASILGNDGIEHPHWTGVWSTRATNGGPLFTRNDKVSGLSDTRESARDRKQSALDWLVSGVETGLSINPRSRIDGSPAKLVGPGTVGDNNAASEVSAPQVAIQPGTPQQGHYAWWVGDLGVKANIATPDAFAGKTPDATNPAAGGWFRLMTSQEADASAIASPTLLDAAKKRRLVSETPPQLLRPQPATFGKHFHDFTTQSEGVLADMANGGLKRDLTAYFLSSGKIADSHGLAGL